MRSQKRSPTPVRTLADLAPDPKNANRGTARGREAVAHSVRAYGPGRAVLIDRHGRIVAGNKTVAAAKAAGLGLTVVETDGSALVAVQRMDLDLVSDERAKALAVADNRTAELGLEWDEAVLRELAAAGVDLTAFWTEDEFDALVADPPNSQADANAVVAPGPTEIVRGDVFALGRHRVLCGDATVAADVARVLDGVSPPPHGGRPTVRRQLCAGLAPRCLSGPAHGGRPRRQRRPRRLDRRVVTVSRRRRLRLARGVACRGGRGPLDGRWLRAAESNRLGQTALRAQPGTLSLAT